MSLDPSGEIDPGTMFLSKLDGMIESTEEFIADDEVTGDNDPEGRLKDLECLNHVRELYLDAFQMED